MNLNLDHRETSNLYRGELFRHGHYRVIVCRDGIQWIIQRQKKGVRARWVALSYCTTQKSLSRVWTARTGDYAPEVDLLPENVKGMRNG